MIKDKHPVEPPRQQTPVTNYQPEEVAENPFVNMYHAVRRAILTVREDPDNPLSPRSTTPTRNASATRSSSSSA